MVSNIEQTSDQGQVFKMKTKDRELLQKMRTNMITLEFSEEEILIIHALAVLGDGRNSLNKIFRKRVSPTAIKLIKENNVTIGAANLE